MFRNKRFINRVFGPSPNTTLPAPVIVNVWQGLNAGGTPITVSPSAGNLLVVFVGSLNGSGFSIVDNIGSGTWSTIQSGNTGSIIAIMSYQKNIPAGITSVTFSGTSTVAAVMSIFEISGASTTAPHTNGESAILYPSNSTTQPSPTISAATANSMLIAGITTNGSSTWIINGPGTVGTWSNFSSKTFSPNSSNEVYNVVDCTDSLTGPHTWTSLLNNGQCGIIIAAFHP